MPSETNWKAADVLSFDASRLRALTSPASPLPKSWSANGPPTPTQASPNDAYRVVLFAHSRVGNSKIRNPVPVPPTREMFFVGDLGRMASYLNIDSRLVTADGLVADGAVYEAPAQKHPVNPSKFASAIVIHGSPLVLRLLLIGDVEFVNQTERSDKGRQVSGWPIVLPTNAQTPLLTLTINGRCTEFLKLSETAAVIRWYFRAEGPSRLSLVMTRVFVSPLRVPDGIFQHKCR